VSTAKDVKPSTVEREIGNMVKNSNGKVTVDQAREVVRKEAEKINHQRKR
jgi:hypothetical protein